jgi:hypothetical protein
VRDANVWLTLTSNLSVVTRPWTYAALSVSIAFACSGRSRAPGSMGHQQDHRRRIRRALLAATFRYPAATGTGNDGPGPDQHDGLDEADVPGWNSLQKWRSKGKLNDSKYLFTKHRENRMLKCGILKLAVAAATLTSALALTVLTAGGAAAATTAPASVSASSVALPTYPYVVYNQPNGANTPNEKLSDHGHGNPITDDSSVGTLLTPIDLWWVDGNPAYLLQISNNGDCLNVGTNGYVYDDSCVTDSSEQFIFASNGAITNVRTGLNLTGHGGDVVVAGGPPTDANIWCLYFEGLCYNF